MLREHLSALLRGQRDRGPAHAHFCGRAFEHLVYSGNAGTMMRDLSLKGRVFGPCTHYSDADVGDLVVREL